MTSQEYSTLAYLARVVATEPEQAENFVAAVRGDVDGAALQLGQSAELDEALTAIADAWRRRKQTTPHELTLRDVLAMAQNLEASQTATAKLAGTALRSASLELLSRRRRELGLSSDERELAFAELPPLAAS